MVFEPRKEPEGAPEEIAKKLASKVDAEAARKILKFPGSFKDYVGEASTDAPPESPPGGDAAPAPSAKLTPPAMEFKCAHGVFWTWAPVAGAWRNDKKTDMASHPCKCDYASPEEGLRRRVKPPKLTYAVQPPQTDTRGKLIPIEAKHGGMKDRERLKEILRLSKKAPGGFVCKETCGKCCESPTEMLRVEWEHLSIRPGPNKVLDEITAAGVNMLVEATTEHAVRVFVKDNPKATTGRCPFLDTTTKKCRIYDERPFVCRAYGQHWFFGWCREGVDPTPEQTLSETPMRKYVVLAGKEYAGYPDESFATLHDIVEAWRAEKPERRDQWPPYEEIASRMRAPEPADLPPATPRYDPAEFTKAVEERKDETK